MLFPTCKSLGARKALPVWKHERPRPDKIWTIRLLTAEFRYGFLLHDAPQITHRAKCSGCFPKATVTFQHPLKKIMLIDDFIRVPLQRRTSMQEKPTDSAETAIKHTAWVQDRHVPAHRRTRCRRPHRALSCTWPRCPLSQEKQRGKCLCQGYTKSQHKGIDRDL